MERVRRAGLTAGLTACAALMGTGCTALLDADDLRRDTDGDDAYVAADGLGQDAGSSDAAEPDVTGSDTAAPDVAQPADTGAPDGTAQDTAAQDDATPRDGATVGDGATDTGAPSDAGGGDDTPKPVPTLDIMWSGEAGCTVDVKRVDGLGVGGLDDTCSLCGSDPELLFVAVTNATQASDWAWDFDKLPAGWAFNLQVFDEDKATARVVLLPPNGDNCDPFDGGTITFSVSVTADGHVLEDAGVVAVALDEHGSCPSTPHDCPAP